jgi:hypothetical protein
MKFAPLFASFLVSVSISVPVLAQNICQVPKGTDAIISEKRGTQPWKVYFLGKLRLVIREASPQEKECIQRHALISNGILQVKTSEGYLEVEVSNK